MISEAALPPGGEGKIAVTVSTDGRQGKMAKSIVLETNDPERPKTHLNLEAEVVMAVGLERPFVRLEDLHVGDRRTERVRIIGTALAQVALGSVSVDKPEVTARLIEEKDEAGQLAKFIEVTAAPTVTGALLATVQVPTTHPEVKHLLLTVSGRVQGDLVFAPEQLTMMVPSPAEKGLTARLSVRQGKLKINKVEELTGRVKATYKVIEPNRTYDFTVALTPEGKKEDRGFNVRVQVHTDSPEQPIVELPVRVRRAMPTVKPPKGKPR